MWRRDVAGRKGGIVNTDEIRTMWATWDAHGQAIPPYRVCREGCQEKWPCPSRTEADARLREMGIDPYAVKRGEASIPA